MILVFDVDCGELVPGHRFIARGLGGPFRLPIPDVWDGDRAEYQQMLEFEEAGGYPGFSFEYELVPGVSAAEAGGSFFRYLVGISYAADGFADHENPAGDLVVDVVRGNVAWRPRLRRPVADRRREDDYRQRNWVEFRFNV
jgi:hypothetical protein